MKERAGSWQPFSLLSIRRLSSRIDRSPGWKPRPHLEQLLPIQFFGPVQTSECALLRPALGPASLRPVAIWYDDAIWPPVAQV